MRKRLSGLRLVVLLLFVAGLFSPIAAIGAGAQELTCDDFNSSRAAQAVLDADPSLEDALDPDGDGVACNEDEPTDDPVDEPTEEPTDDPTEEPTDDPTEEPADDPTDGPSGDADDYLADIQDEVDSVVESFDRLVEIDNTFTDASSSEQAEMVTELEDLATTWSEYPDVAAEFEAPAEFEEVGNAYLDFADLVGEAGDTWLVWWDIPSGDAEEDAAFDEFTEAFDAAYAAADDVTAAIEDAGGSTGPSDDPTEEPRDEPTEEPTDDPTDDPTEEPTDDPTEEPTDDPTEEPTDDPTEEPTDDPTEEPADDPTEEPTDEPSADGEAYVADVQSELDDLTEQIDRFIEINEIGADATEDDLNEINEIAAGWVEYPDVAFDLVAPEGYEDIEDAYLNLADTIGEAGELWEAYWAIPLDDPEEEAAFDEFTTAFEDAQDGIGEVQDLLDDAGGATGPSDDPTEEPTDEPTEEPSDDPTEEPTDDPTEEPTEEPALDADEYLETVREDVDTLQASVDRFFELVAAGEDLTDAEFDELIEIVTTDWISTATLTAPDGLEEIGDLHDEVHSLLLDASLDFTLFLTGGDAADTEFAESAFATLEEAETQLAELDELLTDEGV